MNEATLHKIVDATLYQHQIAAVLFVCEVFGVDGASDEGHQH